jgi:hypothetical protein
MNNNNNPVTFDDFNAVLKNKPALNLTPNKNANDILAPYTHLATKLNSKLEKPLFLAFGGICELYEKDDKHPLDVIQAINTPASSIYKFCNKYNIEAKMYDVACGDADAPFSWQGVKDDQGNIKPAISEKQVCYGLTFGMAQLAQAYDCLILSGFGRGFSVMITALGILLGMPVDVKLKRKYQQQIMEAEKSAKQYMANPWHVIQWYGGHVMSNLCGVLLAARMAGIPVILADKVVQIATLLAYNLDSKDKDFRGFAMPALYNPQTNYLHDSPSMCGLYTWKAIRDSWELA